MIKDCGFSNLEKEILEKALYDLKNKLYLYEQEDLRRGDRSARLIHQDLQRYIDVLSKKLFGREPSIDTIPNIFDHSFTKTLDWKVQYLHGETLCCSGLSAFMMATNTS